MSVVGKLHNGVCLSTPVGNRMRHVVHDAKLEGEFLRGFRNHCIHTQETVGLFDARLNDNSLQLSRTMVGIKVPTFTHAR